MKVNKLTKEFIKINDEEVEIVYPAIYRSDSEFVILLGISKPVSDTYIFKDSDFRLGGLKTHNMETMDTIQVYSEHNKYMHCESQYNKPMLVSRSIYGLSESISQKLEDFTDFKLVTY